MIKPFHDARVWIKTLWKNRELDQYQEGELPEAIVASVYRENAELRQANEDLWLKNCQLARQLDQSGRANARKRRAIRNLRTKVQQGDQVAVAQIH